MSANLVESLMETEMWRISLATITDQCWISLLFSASDIEYFLNNISTVFVCFILLWLYYSVPDLPISFRVVAALNNMAKSNTE